MACNENHQPLLMAGLPPFCKTADAPSPSHERGNDDASQPSPAGAQPPATEAAEEGGSQNKRERKEINRDVSPGGNRVPHCGFFVTLLYLCPPFYAHTDFRARGARPFSACLLRSFVVRRGERGAIQSSRLAAAAARTPARRPLNNRLNSRTLLIDFGAKSIDLPAQSPRVPAGKERNVCSNVPPAARRPAVRRWTVQFPFQAR
jgi:hypothetical protein